MDRPRLRDVLNSQPFEPMSESAMPAGEDWSLFEVEACVADYLDMLTLELNGQKFNKRARATELMQKLDGRSRGSVEFKHANISSALLELGYPYIDGYKPRGNFQRSLLLDVLSEQLEGHLALQEATQAAVVRPALVDADRISDAVWVPAPKPADGAKDAPATYAPTFTAARRDYLAQEARNRSLGRAGELFVVELESRRLHAAGKKTLSDRVEHVAASQGDGLGFDVLSFDLDGRERLIEVKTTSFGELTPFFVSRNELARSEKDAPLYHLYRLFDFRTAPRLFDLPGTISGHCQLDPVSYLARLTA